MNHNPLDAIQQLQSILSSPSKKIGFLFGAGISMEKSDGTDLIIGMNDWTKTDETTKETTVVKEGMTTLVVKGFESPQKEAIGLMKDEIESTKGSNKFNIETLLSIISEKERAVGKEKLCGLDKKELIKLRKDIEESIVKLISLHAGDLKIDIEETNHNTFAKWIKNADRDFPIEVFTTNYDYFLELALENQKIEYFDGFVGGYEAFFCPEWIEDNSQKSPVKDWAKLWKLHGSLGWKQNGKKEVIRTAGDESAHMIYPSFLKYDNSKKQPYLSYMDRLSHFLKQEDTVLFICGYSFGDEHINEIITTGLSHSKSSSAFILKNGELTEDAPLYKEIYSLHPKISVYAQRSAVIGGKLGQWKLDREPSKNESDNVIKNFFDEDAALPDDDEGLEYTYTGFGNFQLGNFKKFTDFLDVINYNNKHLKNEK